MEIETGPVGMPPAANRQFTVVPSARRTGATSSCRAACPAVAASRLVDPTKEAPLTNELPVDAALGKIDYYEAVGFSDHKATNAVWYRLLDCGDAIQTEGEFLDRLRALVSASATEDLMLVQNEIFVGLVRERAQLPKSALKSATLTHLLRQAIVAIEANRAQWENLPDQDLDLQIYTERKSHTWDGVKLDPVE